MKNISKWVGSFMIASTLLTYQVQPMAYADWTNSVYEENTSETIAKGVTHETMLRFTDAGWLNVHILRMDLTQSHNSLDLLIHQNGVGTKAKLSDLAKQNENVIGAINGDFFNMSRSESLGPMVKDNELLSTPFYLPERMATFNVDNGGNPSIDFWAAPTLELNNKTNPAQLKFMAVNKDSGNNDTAILFTPSWGETAPGGIVSGALMVVENNQIKEIVTASQGSPIPKDGFVIWSTGSFANHILQYFQVGDAVELNIASTPDYKNLDLTFGGGAYLVKNGIPQIMFNHEIKGSQPRTAIGYTKDRNELIFVTVDGRTASYSGLSQKELAELMASIGAHEAMNLDGGGSTEMIIRPQGTEQKTIVNNLSGGSERSLMGGIAMVSSAPKTSSVGGIKMETADKNLFVGTTRQFSLKAFDKNFNPMEVHDGEIKWMVTGVKGSFSGNVFKPTTAGKAIVTANYNGAYTAMEINVLDNPISLTLSPSKLVMDKNSQKTIRALAVNNEGYKAYVNMNDLNVHVPTGLGTLDNNGTFRSSNQGGSGIIEVSLGNLKTTLPVTTGFKEKILDDFEEINGTFLSYPAEVTGGYTLSSLHQSGSYGGEIKYDFTNSEATRAAYLVFDGEGKILNERPSKIGLWVNGTQGGGNWLKAKLVDAEGNVQNISFTSSIDWQGWKYIEATVPATMKAPIKIERIYVVEPDPAFKSKGSVVIDDLTAYYPQSIPEGIIAPDPLDTRNVHEEIKGDNGFTFFAHGSIPAGDTLADKLILQKMAKISNETANYNVFTNAIDPTLKNDLQNPVLMGNGSYSATSHKNTLFINLDNRQGGLRQSNFDQWGWLMNTLEKSNEKNVFVILPKPLSFSDPLEETLFKDTLTKFKEEKNQDIWVLTGGSTNKVTPENGVRYVTLKSYPTHNAIDIFNDLNYMIFTANDDKVTYEILPLYTK